MMSEIVYSSVFKTEFGDLVQLKRSLGFQYKAEALAFRRLDIFFAENGVAKKEISKEICNLWCQKRSYESSTNHSNRISTLRVFCNYLTAVGIPAYTPAKGITKHAPKYDAHIYTDDELKRFFAEVDKSQAVPTECPYRDKVMPLFFRILYTSGMRVSELRLLKVGQFNLDEGYITVVNAKNHKERIVPVNSKLVEKCKELKKSIHVKSSDEEYFFMLLPGHPMTLQNLYHNFRRYLEKAGITHTGKGPRIHDFRHTYCVNLLRKWADEEKDLMAYMPYMKTMLGHESFQETAYYLKLTSERFPYIRDQIQKSFPNIVEEVNSNECEFY